MVQAGAGKAGILVQSLLPPPPIHSSKIPLPRLRPGVNISKILKWCFGTTDMYLLQPLSKGHIILRAHKYTGGSPKDLRYTLVNYKDNQ